MVLGAGARRLGPRAAELAAWRAAGCSDRQAIALMRLRALPIAGGVDYGDPGTYAVTTPSASVVPVQSSPNVVTQSTTANLAGAGTITFTFNIDSNPIFDCFVFADQQIRVQVSVRINSADTYRQLGNNYDMPLALVNVSAWSPFTALRVPGSQVQVVLTNLASVATTALSAEISSRSF